MRSFIRWAGSKQQLLSRLRLYWPGDSRRYIEPFCGSACLFFDLEPQDAVLGDLNEELIGALRAVQRDVDLVLECLGRLRRGKAGYYELRSRDPGELTDPERAARFIYLNHYCFNGLYRTDARGRFNVPFGRSRTAKRIDSDLLTRASAVLHNAVLVDSDFEETLHWARPGDLVYLDPPYAVQARRIFSEYWPGSFGSEDLIRLGNCLDDMDKRGILFVVTYADSREARQLFAPWPSCRVMARRNIAGFAGARRVASELLATNISRKGS